MLPSLVAVALMCCSFYAASSTVSDSPYITSDIPGIKNEITPKIIRHFIGGDFIGNFGDTHQPLLAAIKVQSQAILSKNIRHLNAGYTLYQGCELGDCDNKSALVLDSGKQLAAIALYALNWIPARKNDGNQLCAYSQHKKYMACMGKLHKFTVFIPERNLSSPVFEGVKQWAIDLDSNAVVEVVIVPLSK